MKTKIMYFRFHLWHFRDDFLVQLKRKGKRTRGVTRVEKGKISLN